VFLQSCWKIPLEVRRTMAETSEVIYEAMIVSYNRK
jgi:hypothetical protein